MRSVGCVLFVFLIVFVIPSAAAEPVVSGSVSGSLKVGENTVSPSRSIAISEVSNAFWDKGEKVVKVIFSKSPMSAEGIDRDLDRESAIRRQIEGDFIVMSIHKDGKLRVFAYIDEGARNYGFDGGKADIKTKEADRIAGRLFTDREESIGDTPIEFDLTFDAAILPDRKPGTALPGGGGEPGAAYSAYVKAMRDSDFETIVKYCPAGRANYLKDMNKEYLKYEIESMQESAPKETKVSGGELFEGFSFLNVSGKDAYEDKFEGQVKMIQDGDNWRFNDEDLNMVW